MTTIEIQNANKRAREDHFSEKKKSPRGNERDSRVDEENQDDPGSNVRYVNKFAAYELPFRSVHRILKKPISRLSTNDG
ncbi:MAG: hypothetical protein A49_31810 [Methyloceanibacter sp.]|nr:MAG: hypothetical protein A49_31810 [Methyloceanibacter sp.]